MGEDIRLYLKYSTFIPPLVGPPSCPSRRRRSFISFSSPLLSSHEGTWRKRCKEDFVSICIYIVILRTVRLYRLFKLWNQLYINNTVCVNQPILACITKGGGGEIITLFLLPLLSFSCGPSLPLSKSQRSALVAPRTGGGVGT
jgi:hypothetical protein